MVILNYSYHRIPENISYDAGFKRIKRIFKLKITWLLLMFKINTKMSGYPAYYQRTSHFSQNIGIQEDKIEKGWVVYSDEGTSGRVAFEDRKNGKRLLEDVRQGKISHVYTLRLDRLGRSTQNLIETISKISFEYKTPITCLNEGVTTLDSDGNPTATSTLLVNILSSLSEFFYQTNREKLLEGVNRAKILGKYKGRKPNSTEPIDKFINKPKVKKIKEMLELGVGIRKISRLLECSTAYVYKVKRVCLENQPQ